MANLLAVKKPEKKIAVEKLQENHLAGPADETIDQVAVELKENQVVVVDEMPRCETIVFRNQRDPGYPLEFDYAS